MAVEFTRPASAFALDPSRKDQGGRLEDAKHLAFIRKLPCLVTGRPAPSDAAHIRMGSPEHGKGSTGMGTKPDDCWTVPLSRKAHLAQHGGSEREFWRRNGVDPFAIAVQLYAVSGNLEAGEAIIMGACPPWRRA